MHLQHLWCAVDSVEDTGYVLSFGADVDRKGFLPRDAAAPLIAARGTIRRWPHSVMRVMITDCLFARLCVCRNRHDS